MLVLPIVLSMLGVIFSVVFKTNSKYFYWITVLFAAIMSGFRYNTGKDYSIYEDFFTGKIPVSGVEPGFLLFSQFTFMVDNTGRLGFLICSMVTLFGFAYFFNRIYKSQRFLCLHLYLTIPLFYVSSFNLVRSNMAIAIMLFAIIFLIDKKRTYFLITSLIASFLHLSAPLIITPFMFLQKYVKSSIVILPYIGLFGLVAIIGYETDLISMTNYSYYLNHQSDNNPILLISFALVALILFILTSISPDFPLKKWLVISNFFVFFFIVLWYFSDAANIWLRVASLFFVSVIICLIFNIDRIKQKILKKLLILVFSLFLFLYSISKFFIDPSYGFYV